MATRRPLVIVGGRLVELPAGDDLPGGGASSSPVHVGLTPPADPALKPLWFDLVTGALLVYVNDGTTEAWVETGISGNLPPGGAPGQLLLKLTAGDFDAQWASPSGIVASAVHAAAGKAGLDDDDELGISDSDASWGLKKLTWANLKAAVLGLLGGLFGRGNILGAVSQTSGVPTGAVIERGSNANGEYVRFADGLQICTFTQSANVAITTVLSSPIYASSPISLTFPAPFVAAPICSVSAVNSVNAPAWSNSGNASTSGVTAVYLFSYSNTATARAAYTAVGRWF